MKSQSLIVLCLSIALLRIQVEGWTVDISSKADLVSDSSTTKIAEDSNRGRELLQSPPAGTSCFDTTTVQTAIRECENAAMEEAECDWRNNVRISCSFLTVSFSTTQSACCCACESIPECLGVHYSTGKSTCIFHYGGELESDPDPGNSAWMKPQQG